MRESPHVQKLEAPLKRSIRGLFISIEQFIPSQDLTPVPYPNCCEYSKFPTELDSLIHSSRMKVGKNVRKIIRNMFLQSGSSFGPLAIKLYAEFMKQQKWTRDCNYNTISREPTLKRKKGCNICTLHDPHFQGHLKASWNMKGEYFPKKSSGVFSWYGDIEVV